MGKAWESMGNIRGERIPHPSGQPGTARAWEKHGKAWETSGESAFRTRPASQAWQEHGESMGEHGKHQARARHGKSMGKAWESMGNIRREPGMARAWEKHGRAWETSGESAFRTRPTPKLIRSEVSREGCCDQ